MIDCPLTAGAYGAYGAYGAFGASGAFGRSRDRPPH